MRRALLGGALALLLALGACAAPAQAPSPAPSAPAPSAAPGALRVHTDWSALGEREVPPPTVGTRWYGDYTGYLIPRDDYGTLIPYAGLRLMDDWPAAVGCMYGLMTRDGVVVTDPVYSNVYRPGYRGADGGWYTQPLLVLSQGDPGLEEETWNPARYAVAAADGRWCTDFAYRCVQAGQEGLLLFTQDTLSVMAPSGEITGTYSQGELGLSQAEFGALLSDLAFGEGVGGSWYGGCLSLGWADDRAEQVKIFRFSTREPEVMSYEAWSALSGALYWEVDSRAGETVLTRGDERHTIPYGTPDGWVEVQGDLVLFSRGGAVYTLEGEEILAPAENRSVSWMRDRLLGDAGPGLLAVTEYGETGSSTHYCRADGASLALPEGRGDSMGEQWYRQVDLVGGLVEQLDWNTAAYYDPDTLGCVLRTYLNYEGD